MTNAMKFADFKEHFKGFTGAQNRGSALFNAFKTIQTPENIDLNQITEMKMSLTKPGLEARVIKKLKELQGKVNQIGTTEKGEHASG